MLLEGQVVDEGGGPVGGATVWLDDQERVASAPDGRFAFADREPGLYRLRARAGDRCANVTLVTLHEGRAPVVLAIAPGIAMHVRVVHRGAPLAGARVRSDRNETIATTDARGEAIVRGVGAHFQLFEVEADGYAPATLSMWLAPDPGGTIERTVELERGTALGGVVLAPDGTPASGVKLLVFGERWSGEVITDDRGAWRVATAAAGTYRIGADVPLVFKIDHDGATARTDLVISLPAGGRLAGEVRERGGAPVQHAIVIAIRVHETDPGARRERQVHGDPSGRFELGGLTPGTYDVFAHDVARASPVQRVSVAAGAELRVDLVVEPTAIAGVVVDDLGNPVAGADVSADAPSVSGDLADRDGQFYLGALPPGEHRITASWPGDARSTATVVRIAAGARDARIAMPRQATIRGRVLLDEAPLPFFGVAIARRAGAWIERPTGVRDAEGRFTLHVSAPAQHAIAIAGPGSALHVVDDIAVEPGADVDIGEIKLARGQRVTGHVRDEHGTPVAGARVLVGHRGSDDRRVLDPLTSWFECDFATISNSDGAFAFAAVTRTPDGRPPPIAASHASLGCSVAVPVPDGDAEIDLVLVTTGSIEGVVDGGDSFTIVRARRVGETPDTHVARVEPTAAFAFERLPPGEYALEVMRRPGLPVPPPMRVTVVANERARVAFAMPGDVTSRA